MSRRNSRNEKQRRRVERAEQAERTAFIQEASQEPIIFKDKVVHFKNRRERREKINQKTTKNDQRQVQKSSLPVSSLHGGQRHSQGDR